MNTTDIHRQSKASNNVLSGKTARACDSCLMKRARWFCASDDAFLCQVCDSTVHSANQLASRHKRVRLQTSSFKPKHSSSLPAWHQGFTRKPRTPRPAWRLQRPESPHQLLPLVPEINNSHEDQPFGEEADEQLIFRVPVFDAFAEELRSEIVKLGDDHDLNLEELLSGCDHDQDLVGFDVEGLLDNELGFGITDEHHGIDEGLDGKRSSSVKVEEINVDDDDEVQAVIAACHDVELNWNLEEEIMKKNIHMGNDESDEVKKRKFLRLNYEAVMAAWDSQGSSPWTDGIRPQFNLDDELFMGAWLGGGNSSSSSVEDERGGNAIGGGREARVWRYREKRRRRLFSKKIRYEVRKLNADNRPRIKGRFVKTTALSPSISHYLITN